MQWVNPLFMDKVMWYAQLFGAVIHITTNVVLNRHFIRDLKKMK